jgi:hypothetical protein
MHNVNKKTIEEKMEMQGNIYGEILSTRFTRGSGMEK